jgi:O-antigen ligase
VVVNSRKQWRELFSFHFFEWAFFFFCFIGAVSAYLTGVSLGAIIFQLRAFIITYLLFYSVKRLQITKEEVRSFLWTTFVVAIIICLHGLVEKLSLRSWLLPEAWASLPLSATNKIRIYGLIGNPNVLAIYLSFVLFLGYYLRNFVAGKMRWLMNVSLILFFGVFLFTFSRGTWIAVIFGLAIYLVLTKNWRLIKHAAFALITAILFIYFPVNIAVDLIEDSAFATEKERQKEESRANLGSRLSETFDEDILDLSKSTGRLFFITKGFEVFADHPIIGTGFGTYGDSATKSYSSPIYEKYGIERDFYSDNQYIQIIVQTGAIGVLAFAAFIIGMLLYLWKARKETALAPVLLVVLAATIPACMFYNIWENKTFTLYFFTLLGVVASNLRNGEDPIHESSSSN